ncbi:MAG TPA: hypothetical protein VL201_01165 [Patescibacteria group bacterium]|nr:hypothetical protein [Patescibacteria group bacterium]
MYFIFLAGTLTTSITAIPKEEVWITIFVHGIMSIKPHLTLGNFYRFMNDKVINTLYAKEAECIRNDPFFRKTQAMQGLGLHEIDIHKNPTLAAQAIGVIFDQVSQMTNPNRKNYYYTFGWSGLLSPTQRYHDAHELFLALDQLIQKMKEEQGYSPKIRIVGYSHGGNIVLNTAAIKRDYYPTSTLTIDELVLIGVPLVTETDFLVADPMFKKTYHLFSEHDRIQQIDFFSFNRLFSRKKFRSRKGFSLPSTLIQINMKLMKPSQPASNKKIKYATLRSDIHNPAIVSGTSHLLRNVSAGHIELWFFGWTPQHYRRHFILAPLPMMVFIPYIIHTIEKTAPYIDVQEIVTVDIRPKDNLTIVKQPHLQKFYNFFSESTLKKLNNIALSVKPASYTNDEFNEHIKAACKKADAYYHQHIKPFDKLKIKLPKNIRLRKKRIPNVQMAIEY